MGSNEKLKCVGLIHSAKGLQGEVLVQFFSKSKDWPEGLESLVIVDPISGLKKSLRLEKARSLPTGFVCRFAEIKNRNEADSIIKWRVWIPEEHLVSAPGETIFLGEILDFHVYDREELVGPIVGFSSNGPQDLLQVQVAERQVEIPFVDAFLIKIDFELQRVLMSLPPGLWQDE